MTAFAAGPLADADPLILERHARLATALQLGEQLVVDHRTTDLATLAQAIATSAWHEHAGVHASPRFEALLATLGSALPPAEVAWPGWTTPPDVVHILTQAYATGGHTRWSERIIHADTTRVHSVLLTHQQQLPVPQSLRAAVVASGGELLSLETPSVLERAAQIRRVVRASPFIVANVHPDDVAAVVALQDPGHRPPVALLNHADHIFWTGSATPDVIVEFRDSGERLAFRRRGSEPARSAVLPLPLDAPPVLDRLALRRALGLARGDVLLLSAGHAWKFDPLRRAGGPSFTEVLAPIVAANPRLRLLALGPAPVGEWADAARATDGRMLAVGQRTDYADLVAAADIYLDPFPIGSVYSLLEPAAAGVPALSLAQWPADAAVLMSDGPGLDANREVAPNPERYALALHELAADASLRRERGGALAASIDAQHRGPAWLAGFESVLARAAEVHAGRRGAPAALSPVLDEPCLDQLARGLAWIPEMTPRLEDRVVAHVPLAGPSGDPA